VKDLTGTRLGQYEIVERLGGGGMAVVYRAVQQPLGREVALKALSSELFQDDGFVKRFETEAKTLAKLDHPNILPIYDFEVTEGVTFLTMPLIRGGTLRDILNRGPLDTLTAPLDFYGAHFDLILPDNSNVSVTSGSLTLLATHDVVINGNRPVPFRIGPHVPESGNTISLFALALIGLFAISRAGNRSLRPLNGAPPK